ncbi:MAG: hypothetical protein Q9227_003504 [Pyrenula ochraceoflavens]
MCSKPISGPHLPSITLQSNIQDLLPINSNIQTTPAKLSRSIQYLKPKISANMKTFAFASILSLTASGAFAAPEPNRVQVARAAASSGVAPPPPNCHVGYLAFQQDQCANDCGQVKENCVQFTGNLQPVLDGLKPPGPMTIKKYESNDPITITKDSPIFVCGTCGSSHAGKMLKA